MAALPSSDLLPAPGASRRTGAPQSYGVDPALWFWFRWLPVPTGLDDPFAPSRWLLIAIHVGLVAAALLLVGLS